MRSFLCGHCQRTHHLSLLKSHASIRRREEVNKNVHSIWATVLLKRRHPHNSSLVIWCPLRRCGRNKINVANPKIYKYCLRNSVPCGCAWQRGEEREGRMFLESTLDFIIFFGIRPSNLTRSFICRLTRTRMHLSMNFNNINCIYVRRIALDGAYTSSAYALCNMRISQIHCHRSHVILTQTNALNLFGPGEPERK